MLSYRDGGKVNTTTAVPVHPTWVTLYAGCAETSVALSDNVRENLCAVLLSRALYQLCVPSLKPSGRWQPAELLPTHTAFA